MAAPRRTLERTALGVLLLAALFLAVHDAAILAFPHDLIYGEGFLLRDAALLRSGQSPYTPIDALPAVVANYPPVYPLAFALATLPFGVGFFAGRLVSVLATAACAWRLARIARRALGVEERAAALFAPLLFLADLVVYYWSPYARVDMLALALELAALDAYHAAVAARPPSAPTPARGAMRLGHAFALLAIFTRPTALAAPAALAALLAGQGRGREALRHGALLAGAAAALSALLGVATGGEFLRHVVLYNANAFRWGDLPRLLLDFASVHAPLLLGAAAFVALGTRGPADRLLVAFAVFAGAGALLVGKVGSSANYFLQIVAGAALLFAIAVGRSNGALRRVLLAAAIAGPFLATTVPWVRSCELRLNPFPAMGRTPDGADRLAGDAVAKVVAECAGDVLIEDAGFAVRAGKSVFAHPLVLDYLEADGRYDPEPLSAAIRRRAFDAIVLSYGFFSPSIRAAIGEAYRPERAIEVPGRFKYIVLRPVPQ